MYRTLNKENKIRHKNRRLQIYGTLFLFCGLLLFAWLISTREETNLENFIQLGYTLRDQELTLLKLIGAYILGGLLFLPITLLISATVIVFGPFF